MVMYAGQTGSGKTFTMEGSPGNIGVSPRAVNELFRVIDSTAEDWVYTVTFSTLEIYNETIRDLLESGTDREKLDVRQTPQGNSVPGLTEIQVTSTEQVMSLMAQGQSNRAVGSHDMNEHSSRSHSILTLVCEGKCLRDGNTTYGKLHLIDLAGSERIGKTDASGDRLKEAQNINRSLSALGDVINALGNKKNSHVPYRNSKLTFLLQDSLGGNSKVLMFVNISPAIYNLGETVCSLNFAARCRNVELGSAKKQIDNGSSGDSNSSSGGGGGAPLIKSLVKRSGSAVGAAAPDTPASRRSTFGTPSARK
jgi:kinesin family protein C2/C3